MATLRSPAKSYTSSALHVKSHDSETPSILPYRIQNRLNKSIDEIWICPTSLGKGVYLITQRSCSGIRRSPKMCQVDVRGDVPARSRRFSRLPHCEGPKTWCLLYLPKRVAQQKTRIDATGRWSTWESFLKSPGICGVSHQTCSGLTKFFLEVQKSWKNHIKNALAYLSSQWQIRIPKLIIHLGFWGPVSHDFLLSVNWRNPKLDNSPHFFVTS